MYYCIKSAVNITQIGLECREVISELAAQLTKISLMNTFSNMKYRLDINVPVQQKTHNVSGLIKKALNNVLLPTLFNVVNSIVQPG